MIDLKTEHLTEEQLILHCYNEGQGTLAAELRGLHLDDCVECRERCRALEETLSAVDDLPVPDPGHDYGDRVWRSIEHRLPPVVFPWRIRARWPWAAAAVFCGVAILLFAARLYFQTDDTQASRRVLAVAVGDYLERSQAVFLELSNAPAGQAIDISSEQQRAQDLLLENRLYRQTAMYNNQPAVAGALEELERALLDIAHAPPEISPEQLDGLRGRLESESILFKLRVLGANVRNL